MPEPRHASAVTVGKAEPPQLCETEAHQFTRYVPKLGYICAKCGTPRRLSPARQSKA